MKDILLKDIQQKLDLGIPSYYIRTPKEYMMKDLPDSIEDVAIMIVNDPKGIEKALTEFYTQVKWLVGQIPYMQSVMKNYIDIQNETTDDYVKKIAKWEYEYLNELIHYYYRLDNYLANLKDKPITYFYAVNKYKQSSSVFNFKKLLKNVKS